jgi:DNA-binding transcriptional MocR family regulator
VSTAEYDPLAAVQAAGPPGTISFVYGLPDPATFPADDLRRAIGQVLRDRPALALQYGPEQGYGPLIDYLRSRAEQEEGLAMPRSKVILTGGSAQALDHLCTLFTRPGDIVLVEAPTYHESLQLLRDHGLRIIQVATDDEGICVEALEECLNLLARDGDQASLLYLIPNFQNPSGVSLAAARLKPILQLAREHSLTIVEDDVYRDLAYDGGVPPSLFALDGGRQVIRLGSFSKILAPGLRCGWLMASPDRIRRLIGSGLRCMGGGANPLITNALAEYCRKDLLEPHIASLQQVYRQRRDVTMKALKAYMPGNVRWTQPAGGVFTWLTLAGTLRAADVTRHAREEGIMVLAGDPFFAQQPSGQHLRLAYSFVAPVQIEEGTRRLGQIIRAMTAS